MHVPGTTKWYSDSCGVATKREVPRSAPIENPKRDLETTFLVPMQTRGSMYGCSAPLTLWGPQINCRSL